MIDCDADQTSVGVEHWLENRVISEDASRGADVLPRFSRINSCVMIEAHTGQHAAVAYGSAEIVERNSPDHVVIVIDEETRT